MDIVARCLEPLFGKGDSDYPFWLFVVRLNILVFLTAAIWVARTSFSSARLRGFKGHARAALILTVLAAVPRLFLVEHNLSDVGGIGYSRILLGYKGHFGAAQVYSLLYACSARDLEHAIFLNRLASTLTIPVFYFLCARLAPRLRTFPAIASLLLLLHPLHLLFSATDTVAILSSFLTASAFLLLVRSIDDEQIDDRARTIGLIAAASGLALITQVRYENALFLLPAALYMIARRKTLALRTIAPAAVLFASLLFVYAGEALLSGSSYQSSFSLNESMHEALHQAFENPVFAGAPVVIGTVAAWISRRSGARWIAPLPLLIVVPLTALSGTWPHGIARTYVNQILPLSLVGGYGLALMAESSWWSARAIAGLGLASAIVSAGLFLPNYRERYLETAEHDLFRSWLAALPAGIDRVIVPDDEALARQAHSTMESLGKYRAIAISGGPAVEIVGMTEFLEHFDDQDCRRSNCVYFQGLPCMGVAYYPFNQPTCALIAAKLGAPPLRQAEVTTGSILDCSIFQGEARRQWCDPTRRAWQFALYPIHN